MDKDLAYLEDLISSGQEFSYRRARTRAQDDPTWEYSKEKWIEWLTKARKAVQTFAKPGSKALDLIKEAKRLESIGEIADDFYESRESALSALRVCIRELRQPTRSKPVSVTSTSEPVASTSEPVAPTSEPVAPTSEDGEGDIPEEPAFWHQYGKPIAIGVAATVIGGLLLALFL